MQRIKNLFDDDSAVSPVIGVILMVAITVILAAVIASFVLGLGDNTDDVSPNIQFETNWDQTNNETTISINTADSGAEASNIIIRGSAVDGSIEWQSDIAAGESTTLSLGSNDLFQNSGSGGNWTAVEGEEITLIFETDSTSDTLDTFEVPDY